MEDILGLLIPIFGIVFGVGVAMVSIIAGSRRKMQRAELRHKERLAAMDKGLELPPELENDDEAARRPRYLLKGLVWLFVGIALFFALGKVVGDDVGLLGLIPGGVGVAILLYYFIEGRKENGADRPPAP